MVLAADAHNSTAKGAEVSVASMKSYGGLQVRNNRYTGIVRGGIHIAGLMYTSRCGPPRRSGSEGLRSAVFTTNWRAADWRAILRLMVELEHDVTGLFVKFVCHRK